MTRRTLPIVTAALSLVLGLAAPADAGSVSVSGFTPSSGPAGTTVTIRGKGFNSDTQVLIGGQPIARPVIRKRTITFKVPLNIGNGVILLRQFGIPDDIRVGMFRLAVANAVIQSFSPRAGVPGTRVELRGYGFKPTDVIRIGKAVAKAILVRPRRMIIVVPDGARTGRITTARTLKGAQQRTRRIFTVRLPAPTVTAMKPIKGPGGTRVRLMIDYLTRATRVFYGRRPVKIVARGAKHVDVVVPVRARKSRHFKIAGPNGQASSARKFDLEPTPRIERATPPYGLPGTQVTLHGGEFRANDAVLLNGVTLRLIQITGKRIVTRIPVGAKSGRFVLARGTARIPSRKVFDIVYPPVITNIAPSAGAVGTDVTVMGSALASDVEVFYGAQKLEIRSHKGESRLVVRVPKKATNQFIRVRTRGGTARSPAKFEVRVYPEVNKISPGEVFSGQVLTLSGRHLDKARAFYLGKVLLPVVERKPRKVKVKVPDEAVSGQLFVLAYRRRSNTTHKIRILAVPTITRLQPYQGPPGTTVTITGTDFDRRARVFYNKRRLRFEGRPTATKLVVRIPKKARKPGFISVEQRGKRVRHDRRFRLIPPIEVTGFGPKKAKIGSVVTITGNGLDRVSRVKVGRWPATILGRNPESLRFRVPAARPKRRHRITLMEGTTRVKTRAKLRVIPSARIRKFSPRETLPGARVTVRGRYFDSATKVLFGPTPMQVIEVKRRGKRIVVIVPAEASGNNFIIVDDHGVRSRSKKPLRILPTPVRQPRK
jgi:hypothetical protein